MIYNCKEDYIKNLQKSFTVYMTIKAIYEASYKIEITRELGDFSLELISYRTEFSKGKKHIIELPRDLDFINAICLAEDAAGRDAETSPAVFVCGAIYSYWERMINNIETQGFADDQWDLRVIIADIEYTMMFDVLH
jgi:hypothetical protein